MSRSLSIGIAIGLVIVALWMAPLRQGPAYAFFTFLGDRDHLQGTVERVERLHERIVSGAGDSRMFHGQPRGRY